MRDFALTVCISVAASFCVALSIIPLAASHLFGEKGARFDRWIKVGAAVIAVRRGGQIHAFDTINHLFLIGQMIIPGSSYWNFGVGGKPGEVEEDVEGMGTMADLGTNMA